MALSTNFIINTERCPEMSFIWCQFVAPDSSTFFPEYLKFVFEKSKMESELVETKSGLMDTNNNSETISVRLARYLNHIKREKKDNLQHLLDDVEQRSVEQQELHDNDLDDLRDHYEAQLQMSRDKTEKLFQSKLKSAEITSQREKEMLEYTQKTLSVVQNQVKEGESRLAAMEQTKFNCEEFIYDLQSMLVMHRGKVSKLEEEATRLQGELNLIMEQHQDLLYEDANDSILLEIAEFNHLLSAEEKRIKLSTTSQQLNSSQII